MPLILPGNVATAIASTTYSIANSVRFNGDIDDPYFSRTSPNSSPTLETKGTFSLWFKRCGTGRNDYIFTSYSGSGPQCDMLITTADVLDIIVYDGGSKCRLITDRKFRDPSAWYHMIFSYDSTPSTPSASSVRLWINGVLETSFSTATYPSQNDAMEVFQQNHSQMIGSDYSPPAKIFNGYLAESMGVDGQALVNTDFGEFDSDSPTIWKPKDISGIDVGTLGWYCDFEASGTLGNDISDVGDFTANNLAAADQATDTPTNNFATLNIINNYWNAATFSEGNCIYTSNNTADYLGFATSTLGVSKGRWYFEAKTSTASGTDIVGISSRNMTSRTTWLGSRTQEYGYYQDNGEIRSNSADTSYGQTYTANDIIGIYLDLEDNKMYVSDNGSLMNSGTGHSITAAASTDSGFYHLAVGDNGDSTQVWQCNFGGCPAFTVSSAVADDNGYGSFEYSPNITGDSEAKSFYALCTKNIAEFG